MSEPSVTSRQQLEASVLGCMILDSQAADVALTEASAAWFSIREFRVLYSAIDALSRTDTVVDAVTVTEQMMRLATLDSQQAVRTVTLVMETVPHAAHVRHYLDELRSAVVRDRARAIGETLSRQAANLTAAIRDTVSDAANQMDTLLCGETQEIIPVADAVQAWRDEQASPSPYLPTGWAALDRLLLGGIRPGQVVVIAARPGVGKSVAGAQIAGRAAFWGQPALIISLEMRASQISGRLVRAAGGDHAAVARLPLTLVDSVYQIDQICSLIRMQHRRRPLGIVVVDYLQLIAPSDLRIPREQQVSQCSRALKLLANSLRIPIVVLSQLNRDVDKRTGKRNRPRLSDLRESGAIEQDADTVILLHRPEDDEDSEEGAIEMIVGKQREGPTGMCSLWWCADRLSITEISPATIAWADNMS